MGSTSGCGDQSPDLGREPKSGCSRPAGGGRDLVWHEDTHHTCPTCPTSCCKEQRLPTDMKQLLLLRAPTWESAPHPLIHNPQHASVLLYLLPASSLTFIIQAVITELYSVERHWHIITPENCPVPAQSYLWPSSRSQHVGDKGSYSRTT